MKCFHEWFEFKDGIRICIKCGRREHFNLIGGFWSRPHCDHFNYKTEKCKIGYCDESKNYQSCCPMEADLRFKNKHFRRKIKNDLHRSSERT